MIKSLLAAAALTAGLAGYALAQETTTGAPAGTIPETQEPPPTMRHHVHHHLHHYVHHVHHTHHMGHPAGMAPGPSGEGAPAGAAPASGAPAPAPQ